MIYIYILSRRAYNSSELAQKRESMQNYFSTPSEKPMDATASAGILSDFPKFSWQGVLKPKTKYDFFTGVGCALHSGVNLFAFPKKIDKCVQEISSD